MKNVIRHIKKHVIRGLFAIIPIALSYFAVKFLYTTIDQRVVRLVERVLGFSFPGLGLLLVLAALYVVGIVASNVIGKKLFGVVERITTHIPFIRTTYKVGQQVGSTLSLPEKQVFKRAVLVEYLKAGTWTIGFVTGTVIDRRHEDEELLKVYIPTPPNPLSGTMVIVKESQTRDPGWTIEEALKAIMSGGIIGPDDLK